MRVLLFLTNISPRANLHFTHASHLFQVDFCSLTLRNNTHSHNGYLDEFVRVQTLSTNQVNTGKLINLFSTQLVRTREVIR